MSNQVTNTKLSALILLLLAQVEWPQQVDGWRIDISGWRTPPILSHESIYGPARPYCPPWLMILPQGCAPIRHHPDPLLDGRGSTARVEWLAPRQLLTGEWFIYAPFVPCGHGPIVRPFPTYARPGRPDFYNFGCDDDWSRKARKVKR